MNKAEVVFYERVPSRELRQALAPDGFLAPLLAKRTVADVGLEPHLRSGDEVHLYCGLTCLVKGGLEGSNSVWIESHRTYASQPCASRLFHPERTRSVSRYYRRATWRTSEAGFAAALDAFLAVVCVNPRQTKEGAIQARWSRVGEPWIVIDKEAALAYPSKAERKRRLKNALHPSVEEARSELRALALSQRSLPMRRNRWAMPPNPKENLKLDRLAIDPAGNLVLLEIKNASGSSSKVYYAPFQLLQNIWEWQCALDTVRDSLRKLLDARVDLGLTTADVSPLTGGIRAAVGFGEDGWSEEVRWRYAQVLAVANAHLPSGVTPIETWVLKEGRQPVRID